jgi:Domain of unknown function (DUF4136)
MMESRDDGDAMNDYRHTAWWRPTAGATLVVFTAWMMIAIQPGDAKVKTRAQADSAFDFTQAHTFGWSPDGPGDVMLARTASDDPETVRTLAEPVIMEAVTANMPRRGLQPAAGAPDLTIRYYLLLTIGGSAQTLGQFLPAVAQWGIPPFAPSTTSLEVIERGSLVLDLSAGGHVVWRGIDEAQMKMDMSQEKRTELLREAVSDILKQYPPKR